MRFAINQARVPTKKSTGFMKILIVEDERRVGRIVEKALAEQNYVAFLAGSLRRGQGRSR